MTFFDSKHQRAALVLSLLGIGLAIALTPYATGLIAVPVLYVVLGPVFRILSRLIGRRFAAVAVVVLTVLLVVLPGLSIVGLLVDRAQEMARQVTAGPLLDRLSGLRFGPFEVGPRLVALSEQIVTWLGSNALKLVGTATRFALNLLLALFGLYYLLLNGQEVWVAVRPYIPFSEANAEKLRTRFRDVTTSTVIGTGLTALAQGVAVALSFAFTGLSDPLFWGVVTIVFAILPVLGSGMIWIPAVAVLAIGGRLGAAMFVTIWNLAATGVIDYGMRPLVFNRFAQIHPLITLVGAVAGVSYLGLLGLLVGPLALSYFFEILRMYREEYVPVGTSSGFTAEFPAAAGLPRDLAEPTPPAAPPPTSPSAP
jgi:predicted PurR-regulated permease PerM